VALVGVPHVGVVFVVVVLMFLCAAFIEMVIVTEAREIHLEALRLAMVVVMAGLVVVWVMACALVVI
jgi:hypothetical protein